MQVYILILILKLAIATPLLFASKRDAARQGRICPWMVYGDNKCLRTEFRCFDGTCIERGSYCDDVKDCEDGSDEEYCKTVRLGARGRNIHNEVVERECANHGMRRCPGNHKCIPDVWFCDGKEDCSSGEDEICDRSEQGSKLRALRWLETKGRVYQSLTSVWGSLVDKYAVAFYLGNTWLQEKETRRQMAYELSIQLLSRLSQEKLEDIPSHDLASYLNAFLVTCLDPRRFHGLDIVQELRNRVDSQNYTNPYFVLSLCNAGETITALDKRKVMDAFENKRKALWMDIQSLSVMALACASKQSDDVDLMKFAALLKQQYRNETAHSVQTSALVMQALISAHANPETGDFQEEESFQNLTAKQSPAGDFGNFENTYYVLPVLNCRSLADINADHCESYYRNDSLARQNFAKLNGPQIRVRLSEKIGNNSDMERTLALRVPANVSLYKVMQITAEEDHRFEYAMQGSKPFVHAVLRKQDDPEKGKFWLLYSMKEGDEMVLIEKSPDDVIPEDNQHFVLWYQGGHWME